MQNLSSCLKPIQPHVVDFREYQIRLELRFGVLIMDFKWHMQIFRMRCYITVEKERFITSVFLFFIYFLSSELEKRSLPIFFFVVYSHLPVSILNHPTPLPTIFSSPFPAPPGNQTAFHQWTAGATYYSTIVLAEAFGTSNTSQIVDLKANGGNNLTPAYAIYEQGVLSKVVLFNYMDGRSNDLQVTIQLPNGAPQSVQVK